MALLQIVEFRQDLDPSDIFAWRYVDPENPRRSDELGNWTQLIVQESQEAILFRDGQALDRFGPGRYTLSTDNIPILRKLLNLPTGGESPFKASVWFVNKVHVLDIKWGTAHPLQLKDPEYKIPIPVRAYGQFGVRVEDARKFLVKLVGTRDRLDRATLVASFKGLILNRIGDLIASYLVKKKINVFEVSAYLGEMADESVERLKPVFEDYGISVVNFYVGSVNVPEDDPAVVDIRKAMSERARMEVVGYDYRQMRSFDAMEKLAESGASGASPMMGAGLGLGMGMGAGGAFGRMAGQMAQELNAAPAAPVPQPPACPHCGNPCREGTRFCTVCGKPLASVCPKCSATVERGARFCPECGAALQRTCVCGAALESGSAFCPNCGKRVE
ncbi:SPFH domain-containing protein [Fretibacterium sp. OH1220_COT-178]|uniref:SPFH domain-containing protein n=1 Tax=Fretibacterium sp. OH1220_COT-178 TaxID=2491047 RepID=UPI000F5FC235|nr:SPFH domain-containing protein [Fretibacterium sp. OH1220_COT-178]RRD65027.1 SPFH domain-containing protein [Fretibacterium sp. OH1220_COT-178]